MTMRGKRPGLHGGIRRADGTVTPPPAADGFDLSDTPDTDTDRDPHMNLVEEESAVSEQKTTALANPNGAALSATVPPGLPFEQAEWEALSPQERTEALAFFREEQRETTDGLDITFPRVPYPTSGASFWEVPTATGEPESRKTLEGVVVFKKNSRAWWPLDAAVGNNPPDCSSLDGITPVPSETQQATSCGICSHAKFGSGKDGHGQACKQRLQCFVLLGDEEIPTLISLPPSALKAFSQYAVQLRKMNSALLATTTVFGLTEATSQGGIKYKALTLKTGRLVSFTEMKKARAIRDVFEAQMSRRGVATEEATTEHPDDAE